MDRLMPEAAWFLPHCCYACWERERRTLPADAFVVQAKMITCTVCGDKRCTKASNHLYACGRSVTFVPTTTEIDPRPRNNVGDWIGEALGKALGPD